MNAVCYSNSEEATYILGREIGKLLFQGAFLALWGGLGAGKTAFARGVGAAFDIHDITSPTFTIMQVHEGKLPLYHFDVYRLSSGDELYDIGFDERELSGGVTLMEWPENVIQALSDDRLDILIEGNGDKVRRIFFDTDNPKFEPVIRLAKSQKEDEKTC
ncbi:tRNA (adenosine(37)-N6)-threonylcarbamoyltransferase complex ATPase subunit type 1 TsaE [Christensenellaceae bacterium OttesenSCG-928-M15]|nr:tRNA (adenosine(37)-N6)-threonylcarbamoyltransferase complex ATPase subunit type 1 TsaE [Christensenellaceae bacterium OttesenSCG-928-M15]